VAPAVIAVARERHPTVTAERMPQSSRGSLQGRHAVDLPGFVHEISIDPDAARGVITFYELPISSLMMVPGARVALIWNNLPSRRRGLGFTVKTLLC